MANNRLFLVHKPTGYCLLIGKRMGYGWYNPLSKVEDKFTEFFEKSLEEGDQDDFVLCIETEDDWDYDYSSDILKIKFKENKDVNN